MNPEPIELTEEHKSHYPEWKARYIAIQLKTGLMDTQKVAQTIQDLYASAGFDRPKVFFSANPILTKYSGAMASKAIRLSKKGCTPSHILGSMLKACIILEKRINIEPSYKEGLSGTIFSMAQKLSGIEGPIGKPTLVKQFNRATKASQINLLFNGGNTIAYSHAHLTFFRDIVGATLPEAENFALYEYLNENSGPRMMHRDFVIITHLPVSLRTNSCYFLHNTRGPAVLWSDGYGEFHLHGTKVPGWVVKNRETIQPSDCFEIDDELTRNVCMEYLTKREWEA